MGLAVERRGVLKFITMEYVRKISLALVVVFAQQHLWLHYMTMVMTSVFLIILSGWIKVRATQY